MILQDAIKRAQNSSGKIRLARWLPECHVFVENGHIRNVQNGQGTGMAHTFSIDELLEDSWEVVDDLIADAENWLDHNHIGFAYDIPRVRRIIQGLIDELEKRS